MFSGLVRLLCVFWVFGYGAYALGGGAVGVIVAAIVALGVNYLWREQQRQRFAREHRDAVIADEDLRLEVRQRRADEGRTP